MWMDDLRGLRSCRSFGIKVSRQVIISAIVIAIGSRYSACLHDASVSHPKGRNPD